jgi:hypothetical protein
MLEFLLALEQFLSAALVPYILSRNSMETIQFHPFQQLFLPTYNFILYNVYNNTLAEQ